MALLTRAMLTGMVVSRAWLEAVATEIDISKRSAVGGGPCSPGVCVWGRVWGGGLLLKQISLECFFSSNLVFMVKYPPRVALIKCENFHFTDFQINFTFLLNFQKFRDFRFQNFRTFLLNFRKIILRFPILELPKPRGFRFQNFRKYTHIHIYM